MKIHKYFHWAYHKFGLKHRYNLGTGLFIWLFLLLARPFGVYVNDLDHFFALALFLLPVAITFVFTSYLVDYLFQKSLKIDLPSRVEMDVIAWLIKLIFFVHIIYLMRLFRCDWECFDLLVYLEQWFAFTLMMVLTYIPLSLYGRSRFFHSLVGVAPTDPDELRLNGEGKEQLIVNLEELLLLKADDNYVDVYLTDPEVPTKKTIRATLTSLSNQLSAYPQFQQVHRSFIVNIKYTKKKNFNTLAIKKGEWSWDIPLSPSFKDSVKTIVS